MRDDQSIRCSHCGKQNTTNIRTVVCASESHWFNGSNPQYGTHFYTDDGAVEWNVALCESCIPIGYKIYLKNQRKRSAIILGGYSLLFPFSMFLYYMKSDYGQIVGKAMSVAAVIGVIVGIIGIISKIVNCIGLSIKIRSVNNNGVPSDYQEECFIGEGERILKERGKMANQDTSGCNLYGEYPLPEFLDIAEVRRRGEKVNGRYGRGQWYIRSVISNTGMTANIKPYRVESKK